jgi:hypothetical protein
LSLQKFLYGSASPIDRIDPSGYEDLTSQQMASGIQGNLARSLGRQYVRSIKNREWEIWRVDLGQGYNLLEHSFIWAKNIKSGRAWGYHVLADKRDMVASRNLGIFIPGIFVVIPQQQMNVVLGIPVQTSSGGTMVMVLSSRQVVLWNALTIAWGSMEVYGDVAFGGFPYKLGCADCKTWVDKAVLNAVLIGSTPF